VREELKKNVLTHDNVRNRQARSFGLTLPIEHEDEPEHEHDLEYGVCPQFSRSNAATHALGVVPNVSRKRATKAPGCW
jgi:hypothetical protein